MKGFRAEIETGQRLQGWADQALLCSSTTILCSETSITCAALAGVLTTTIEDESVYVITRVLEDGVDLEEAAAAEDVDTTPSSWYFDPETRALRVHLTDPGADVADIALVAVILETVARGASVVAPRTAGGAPLFWDARIAGLPSISQRIPPEELGAGAIAALSALTLLNEDGRYDRLITARIFDGFTARIGYGELALAFDALDLWLEARMQEPAAGDRCSIPLVSLASRFNQPAIAESFQVTAYPNMDAGITGFNIPVALGACVGAEAFRIASGRWKWSKRLVIGIDAVKTKEGDAVTVTGTDHANGEFTVNASYDTSTTDGRLYVTGRGADLDYPGELLADLVQTLGSGLAAAEVDTVGLAALDEARAAKIGLQPRTDAVKDWLDLIARSAFIDYFVGRTPVVSARARKRDQGNYLADGEFETDAAGFEGVNGAVVARTTALAFLSTGALSITKPAGEPLAYAVKRGLNLKQDTLYVVTCLAALRSGVTSTARLALTDSDGNEYFSEDYTLSATRWTRMTLFTSVPLENAVIFCSSTTVLCSSTTYLCSSAGGDLRVYAQYGGATEVEIVIDQVQAVEVIVLDDSNAEIVDITTRDPLLWRVRPQFAFDLRTQRGQFGNEQDATLKALVDAKLIAAESRELHGQLVDADDAALVGAAALAYAGSEQCTIAVRLLDPDVLIDLGGDKVIYLNTTRRPSIPDEGQLFPLVALDESRPEDGPPEIRIEAEVRYDPVHDPMVIAA